MKKYLFVLLTTSALISSCIKNNDGNGNSNVGVVPLPPTDLTVSILSTTQVNLSWTDKSTNEDGFKIQRKTGTGTFSDIGTVAKDVTTYSDNGLASNTTYVYRVYSFNNAGNSPTYSNEVIVLTLGMPRVLTEPPTVGGRLAASGGVVESEGTSPVTERGVVWSTQQNPSIALSTKTIDGSGIGKFISSIIDLAPNTTYYLRAYAKNEVGTSYGNQISFTTGSFNLFYLSDNTAIFRNCKMLYSTTRNAYDLVVRNENIYVAGSQPVTGMINPNSPPFTTRAFITLNGSTSYLTDKEDGRAWKIWLNNSDIYVGGEIDDRWVSQPLFGLTYIPKPVIWKNGTPNILSNSEGRVSSVVTSGADVYACGVLNNKPVFWKNGNITELSNSDGQVSAIKISGNDIYMAGAVRSGNVRNAVFWKNGVLSVLNNSVSGRALFIDIINSDVYIGGFLETGSINRYIVWKNGSELFSISTTSLQDPSFALHEGNFYILGGRSIYKNDKILGILDHNAGTIAISQ